MVCVSLPAADMRRCTYLPPRSSLVFSSPLFCLFMRVSGEGNAVRNEASKKTAVTSDGDDLK